jgi:hypothetical protein
MVITILILYFLREINLKVYLMKNIIFRDWSFFRILRLAIGLAIIVEGLVSKSWGIAILGLYFTILPLLNIGCCGVGNCSVPRSRPGVHGNSLQKEKSSI